MNNLSCAFVGHHPLRFPFGYDEDDEMCIRIKNALHLQILSLYEEGVTDFYTDCEVGASMWGAELVLQLMQQHKQLRLFCVLPYEDHAKKWTPELRERYFYIHEKSCGIIMIGTHYSKGCHKRCGKYLVNHADILIAIYDSEAIPHIEPATQLIAYARKKGREIIYIYPDAAKVNPITIKYKNIYR